MMWTEYSVRTNILGGTKRIKIKRTLQNKNSKQKAFTENNKTEYTTNSLAIDKWPIQHNKLVWVVHKCNKHCGGMCNVHIKELIQISRGEGESRPNCRFILADGLALQRYLVSNDLNRMLYPRPDLLPYFATTL